MALEVNVFIFGDQTYDSNAKLLTLLRPTDNPVLTSFFERAFFALRGEIGKLSSHDRVKFPRFSSIADLLIRQREDGVNPALESVLTTIYHFGTFISQQGEGNRQYPFAPNNYVVGLCTGSLAAAAVAASNSVSQLLANAVETVLIAFRIGLSAMNAGIEIQPNTSLTSTWSIVFPGIKHEVASDAMTKFIEVNHLPPSSKPYISAYALNGLTVSGPPSVLEDLQKWEGFSGKTAIKLPIRAPYHAGHLFTNADITSIISASNSDLDCSAHTPFISSATGTISSTATFRTLLEIAIRDILIEPIRLEELSSSVASILEAKQASRVKLSPLATNAEQTLQSALKQVQAIKGNPPLSFRFGQYLPMRPPAGSRFAQSKLAIIGMSGRFPEANSNEAFWNILENGLDVHKVVPELHWSLAHVDVESKRKNTSATPYGNWLVEPGMFDARFFNMSPREAPQVDPAQRLALLTAYEAIEQAGIVPEATPSTQKDRVGVFFGVTSNDWMETNSAQDIDTYFIPGGNRAFIPGRINYFFKFSGPSYSVDTACSSSLAAIHVACNSLWKGDIDCAIAGGTNVLTNPDFTAGLDRGHFLSRTGNCKTFDDSADGYCRGEGVGTVIIKRLEDALADNDPIQGLILGAYTNHSAEAESITRPHVGAQKQIFEKILSESGMDPYKVSYVEMHGTGTQAGDAGEMESVLSTFAPQSASAKRRTDQALYLGSAKANIGHGEAASGITSLAKILMMMRRDLIPPHAGIKTKINHKFPTDLDERQVKIAKELVAWPRGEEPRRVFLNNFSAAGGNTSLLLEDAPLRKETEGTDPRTTHLVAISAKGAASMRGNLKSMLEYLDTLDNSQLGRLSYTTTARRIHHPHRVMIAGSDIADVKAKLNAAIANDEGVTRAKSVPKVGFTFTGQGSQYPGMGKIYMETFPSFKNNIQRFDKMATSQGFPSILPIFQASGGDIGEFSPTVVQLAATAMQMALARLWTSWGIVPESVVGHSLGEYAALNVAGVLSDSDTLYLVGKRAQLLESQCERGTHAMLAVLAPLSTIESLCSGKKYEVACINGPEETVLSGTNEEISECQKAIAAQKLKAMVLKVPYAFHSSQVEPILETFEASARGVTFREPKIPVISPLHGTVIKDAGIIDGKYLAEHCRQTVNLLQALRAAKENNTITNNTFLIEFGPHPVVSGMVKATLGSQMTVLSTLHRNRDAWSVLTGTISALYLAGADIKWAEYHRCFPASHVVLQTPRYSWDLKHYWMQYTNDWSLRKGDAPIITTVPKLETTTVHKTIEEVSSGDKVTLIVESDIVRGDLNPLVQGHKVDGMPLCTPSVYADIAMTLGKYLLDVYKPNMKERIVDIADMDIQRALIAKKVSSQPLRTAVEVDWKTKSAKARFYSTDENGKELTQHSNCVLRFVDNSSQVALRIEAPAIKARIRELQQGVGPGKTDRFNASMVYKVVGILANFHDDYRGMDEVIMDNDTMEAVSKVSFEKVKKGGNFNTHPAYIDNLSQLGGFIMNARSETNLDAEAFVNHGWDSFQIFEPIDGNKIYQTYTKMHQKEGTKYQGDVTCFDGDKVVASFKGVTLLGVSRRLLNFVLSSEAKPAKGKAKSATPAAATIPAAPVAPVVKTAPATPTPAAKTTKKVVQTKLVQSAKVDQAMAIIAEESGVSESDLTEDCVFADMGVDSLLSLVISSRFREELDLDLQVEQMFTEYPTVKDLKTRLNQVYGSETTVVEAVEENADEQVTEEISTGPQNVGQTEEYPEPVTSSPGVINSALEIIAEESGVAMDELTDDSNFADMGVDSLLSLVISSRFREELDLDLEVEQIFTVFPTVRDLKEKLGGGQSHSAESDHVVFDQKVQAAPQQNSTNTSGIVTPSEGSVRSDDSSSSEATSVSEEPVKKSAYVCPPASSVILQGSLKQATKTLFFFPDGCGSSSSYTGIPRVDSDVAIVGLNSPFIRKAEQMKLCTVDQWVDSYLTEVRRRQPRGPYHFGGWSAGGICAYRAAQKVIESGEEVRSLLLIDSPAPYGLDRLPQHFYDYCDKIGVFGQAHGPSTGVKAPEWLIPHFNGTIDILHNYWAKPLPAGKSPTKVSIIWASHSVIDGVKFPKMPPHQDDTEGMRFLTEDRTDFSPCGWEKLFPGIEPTVQKTADADHFSMMRGEHGPKLAEWIKNSLA